MFVCLFIKRARRVHGERARVGCAGPRPQLRHLNDDRQRINGPALEAEDALVANGGALYDEDG